MHLMQVTPFGDRCLCGQFSALGQRLGLTKRCDTHFRLLVAAPLKFLLLFSVMFTGHDVPWWPQIMMFFVESLWYSGVRVFDSHLFFFGYSLCSFSFLKNYFFYWRIVALQCCVGFYCTTKWISHMCTYTPSLLDFLPIQVTTGH